MHSADLAAHTLSALMRRTGVDPGAVDDVILGCCDTIGSQAGDIARSAWLVAGLPDHVPGVTIDRQCGSSQQAVHFAAQGVMSGTQDLVVAGGVQNMSAIPISAAMIVGQQYGFSTPFAESPGWQKRYGDQEVSQFRSAEMIAEKWDISREDMEEFALASHDRARTAIAEGRFKDEIEPVGDFAVDQCPRETSLEKMAGLEPLAPGGRITAAVASQICDASTAMLVASEAAVREHGLTPRARVHHLSVRGDDPVWMLTGPIEATRHALAKSGSRHRRHRPVRVQRGLRLGRAGLDEGDRGAAREGQRQRRRHRPGSPHRRDRHPADDHAAQRARAHRRPLRPADHVRGRRPGQRHHHRAALSLGRERGRPRRGVRRAATTARAAAACGSRRPPTIASTPKADASTLSTMIASGRSSSMYAEPITSPADRCRIVVITRTDTTHRCTRASRARSSALARLRGADGSIRCR